MSSLSDGHFQHVCEANTSVKLMCVGRDVVLCAAATRAVSVSEIESEKVGVRLARCGLFIFCGEYWHICYH